MSLHRPTSAACSMEVQGYDRRHDFHADFYYDLPLGSNRLRQRLEHRRHLSNLERSPVYGRDWNKYWRWISCAAPEPECATMRLPANRQALFVQILNSDLFRLAHCSGCERFPGRKSGTQHIHRTFLHQLRLQHHKEHAHLGAIHQSVPRGILQHLQQHEFQCSEFFAERPELRPDYRRGGRARIAVRLEVYVVRTTKQ